LKDVPGNYYRLNRILEILLITGRPLSELDLDVTAPLDYDFRCYFLNRDRVDLYRRIDARCEEMVAGGLLQVKPSVPRESSEKCLAIDHPLLVCQHRGLQT
jgi:tRNA A37 N6-isopentenylltransferase MiaA